MLHRTVIALTVNVSQMDSVAATQDGPLPLMVPLVLNATPDSSLPLPGTAKSVRLDALHVRLSLESVRLARLDSRRTPMITRYAMLPLLARAAEPYVLPAVLDPVALRPVLPVHLVVKLVMDQLRTIV